MDCGIEKKAGTPEVFFNYSLLFLIFKKIRKEKYVHKIKNKK